MSKPDWELVLINSYGFKYSFTWGGAPPQYYRFPLPTKVSPFQASDSMPDSAPFETLEFKLWKVEGNVATYRESKW